ncbi:MAG: arsenate reductase ArsC [Deltaproteobacteria bacterium]|nr:arsenate reductase ArsC [Deltaproteobacteria bacterium]
MNSNKPVRTILFVSTGDAVRAPMARGLVNALFGDRYRAASAGTEPAEADPVALEVMQEAGVDISGRRLLRAGEISDVPVDFLVTLCDHAKKVCPLFASSGMAFHKGFPEPASFPEDREARIAEYRKLRDDIRSWLEQTFG